MPYATLPRQGKLFFAHFRDCDGTREHFHETFHDDGPTDMARVIRTYAECGYNGPIRVDHVPTMAGERNDAPATSCWATCTRWGI